MSDREGSNFEPDPRDNAPPSVPPSGSAPDPGLPFDPENEADRRDADDPRRQKDCFAPPTEPCECCCLHCGRVFMSDLIWFQKVRGARDGFEGFWMCPTPNCSGAGFTFDIFPTDPAHPANAGWVYDDDDDDVVAEDELDANAEWDPDETQYKALDDELADDGDLAGEEWKFGLGPGEQPPAPQPSEAHKEWEEEQRSYDAPDERPRERDWTDEDPGPTGPPKDEDIPF